MLPTGMALRASLRPASLASTACHSDGPHPLCSVKLEDASRCAHVGNKISLVGRLHPNQQSLGSATLSSEPSPEFSPHLPKMFYNIPVQIQ